MARRKFADIKAANDAARAALAAAAATPALDPDHLGDLAWWDPISAWKGDVLTVADAFRLRGFDPDQTLPPSPDWTVAFGRAVTHVRATLRERDCTLIDAAAGPNGERRVAIVRIARNGVVSTTDEGTIACPKDGASPYVERADPAGVASEIMIAARGYFGRYTSADVRAAIVDTFERWAAMACRACPPHVVYWIPPAGGDVARRLADAVDACGWGRIELFAGHASDERSRKACVNAVNDGLETKLKAFSDEVQKYADADGSKTRISTIESKLAEAARLRTQGSLYREILGAAVTGIDDRLVVIETSLRATLGMVEAARAAA